MFQAIRAAVQRFDHLLEMLVPTATPFDDVCPGLIVDYLSVVAKNMADTTENHSPPPGGNGHGGELADPRCRDPPKSTMFGRAGLVTFPLQPKPHHFPAPWVRRFWLADEAETNIEQEVNDCTSS